VGAAGCIAACSPREVPSPALAGSTWGCMVVMAALLGPPALFPWPASLPAAAISSWEVHGDSLAAAARPLLPCDAFAPSSSWDRNPFQDDGTQLGLDAAGMQHQQPLARRVSARSAAAERRRSRALGSVKPK
jgi:hypothetical protein